MAAGPGSLGLDSAALENRPAHPGPNLSDLQKAHAPHRRVGPLTPALSSMNDPLQVIEPRPTQNIPRRVRTPFASTLKKLRKNSLRAPSRCAFAPPTRMQLTWVHSKNSYSLLPDQIPVSSRTLTQKAKGKGAPPGSFNP